MNTLAKCLTLVLQRPTLSVAFFTSTENFGKWIKVRRRKLVVRKTQLNRVIGQRNDVFSSVDSWEAESFSWSGRLKVSRTETFAIEAFRDRQLAAMNALLSGEDVILIMSTGGGKSLCYQLPAAISNGITLVISPLLSLIEDQLMALEQFGVSAATLNASSSRDVVTQTLASMTDKNSPLRLLFVTPEKVAKSKRFMNKLEKMNEVGRFDRIAIDEVHCCSQWGHDFRPDYKFLNVLKRQFPRIPIIGLTATATSRVIDDVKAMLNIPGALVFRAGFNRPNLFYEVRQKPSSSNAVLNDLSDLISNRFANQSGIVYCFSRKESEEVTRALRSRGVKAGCYHADVPLGQRSSTHRKWTANIYQVVVATVAFGMGIDKPDVRFVIHHSIPKSVENYYQESGRAGRDGLKAYCILYYRYADLFRQSSMVCTEKQGPENLYAILAYCTDEQSCRRLVISRHFGETWEPSWCQSMCDRCATAHDLVKTDITKPTRQIISILRGQKDRITGAKLIECWSKSGGKGSALPAVEAEKIVAHLLLEGYLREDYHFTPYNIISYVVPGFKANVLDQKSDHSVVIVCPRASRIASVGVQIGNVVPAKVSSKAFELDDRALEELAEAMDRGSEEPQRKKIRTDDAATSGSDSLDNHCVVLD